MLLIRSETAERRPLDWRILGGGIAFGAVVLALALGGVPFAQELIFVLSMAVICTMLVLVTRELDPTTRRAILFTSIIIFAFRATPSVGDGYFWWTLDVLKFDEAFYGTLRQTAAIIAIVAMWIFSKQLTEYSVTKVLFWLAIAGSDPVAAEYRAVLRAAPLDRGDVRLRRAHDRRDRCRDRVAVRAAQHDPAADADRVLRAGGPSRDLVRADGLADEPGAGRGPAADQVSQSDLRRRARRLRRARRAADHRDGARLPAFRSRRSCCSAEKYERERSYPPSAAVCHIYRLLIVKGCCHNPRPLRGSTGD